MVYKKIRHRNKQVLTYNEPWMQENGLNKFRTIVSEVLSFVDIPVSLQNTLKNKKGYRFESDKKGINSQKYKDQEPSVYCSGRRSKQRIKGQRIIFEGKGPKGWNKNILLLYFPYWPESQKSYVFALILDVLTWFFVGLQYHIRALVLSLQLPWGPLGLFTFLPQCTVYNMRKSELGVPVYSSLVPSNQNWLFSI